MAKTTPIEFFRQVQAETKKVVWPTRRETVMTGVMVMIMTGLLAAFFFFIDTIFEALVKFLLSLAVELDGLPELPHPAMARASAASTAAPADHRGKLRAG